MDAMWNTGLSPDDCAYAVHKCLLFLPVESYLPLPRASLNRGDWEMAVRKDTYI